MSAEHCFGFIYPVLRLAAPSAIPLPLYSQYSPTFKIVIFLLVKLVVVVFPLHIVVVVLLLPCLDPLPVLQSQVKVLVFTVAVVPAAAIFFLSRLFGVSRLFLERNGRTVQFRLQRDNCLVIPTSI